MEGWGDPMNVQSIVRVSLDKAMGPTANGVCFGL